MTSEKDGKTRDEQVAQFELQKTYVLPKLPKFSRLGDFDIKFSEAIKIESYEVLKSKLPATSDQKEESEEPSRLLQDGEEKQIDENSELVAISQLLKLTGCIQAEIVPGIDFEDYIDKKAFTWQLIKYNSKEFAMKF